ncbi:MAG: hypothetical protein Alpg2KO_15530 [Alphaproteobacteria bacterium]
MIRTGLATALFAALLGSALPAKAQLTPTEAQPVVATGQSQAVTFDPYAHNVMGVKIGMTRLEAAHALEQNQLQLANTYSGGAMKQFGTHLNEMPTLECTTLTFRFREITAGASMPRLMLNLTYPMPDEPQRVWSMAFVNKFDRNADIDKLYRSVVARFGEPDRMTPSSIHGGRTLFYGKGLRLKPYFDNSKPQDAARGITGLWVEIRGPESDRPWGELRIQIGDYNLWTEAEDKARRYMRQVRKDSHRCIQRDVGPINPTGQIDF